MTFHPTHVVVGAAVTAFSLAAILSVAPPTQPSVLQGYIAAHAQRLDVAPTAKPSAAARDEFSATPASRP